MKYLSILLLGFIIFNSYGIEKLKKDQIDEFNSRKNWLYFDLDEPIHVKIISHLPTSDLCGTIAVASVTIAETKENDTIRILDLCGSDIECQKNDIIKITPAKKPEFNVILPYTMLENPKTRKMERFDIYNKILRTTYGNLSK